MSSSVPRSTWSHVRVIAASVALFGAGLVGGCAHKQNKTTLTDNGGPTAGSTAAPAPEKNAHKACTADADCGDGQLCINKVCVDVDPSMSACGVMRVHFTKDSAEIVEEDRPQLARAARCLKASMSMHVNIEGNADERGTEEYNVALGDRRAQSVKKYLESLGATAPQLETVSYGKDNPLCTEHDEACWSKNRRAAVKPTTKKGG